MQIYYHKTDGGAEWISTTFIECPDGHKEGTLEGAFARVDGGELEILPNELKAAGFNRLKIGNAIITIENK